MSERLLPGRYMTLDAGGVYFESSKLIEVFDLEDDTTVWRYLGSCMAFVVCERFPRDKIRRVAANFAAPPVVRSPPPVSPQTKAHELALQIECALIAYQAVRGVDQLLDPVFRRIEELKSHCTT